MSKTKVAIGFKSGNNFILNVDEMKVQKGYDNQVIKIEWTGGPRLLFMSLSDIEYIIEDTK